MPEKAAHGSTRLEARDSPSSGRFRWSLLLVSSTLLLVLLCLCVSTSKWTLHAGWTATQPFRQASRSALFRVKIDQPTCPSRPTPFPASFWYVKSPKTGSSTLSGVFRSICAHYGITPVRSDLILAAQVNGMFLPGDKDRTNMSIVAKAVHLALEAPETNAIAVLDHLKYKDAKAKLMQTRFLFSSVRHPASRVFSYYFEELCWNGFSKWRKQNKTKLHPQNCWLFNPNSTFGHHVLSLDTDSSRRKFVMGYAHNHCYNYMRGNATTVKDVLDQYDFVFVAERMDESLVAFMLVYGLSFEDIAYLRSKDRSDTYKAVQKLSPDLKSYLERHNQVDIQLWQLASERLDKRIAELDRECGAGHFEQQLTTFKALQAHVGRSCSDYKAWYAEHGFTGRHSYLDDYGWGYRCVLHEARLFLHSAS